MALATTVTVTQLDPVALSGGRWLGAEARQIRTPLPVLFPVPQHTKLVCPEEILIVILQRLGSMKQRGRPVSRTPSPHPFLPGQGPHPSPDLRLGLWQDRSLAPICLSKP